jgi:hypothetical protein
MFGSLGTKIAVVVGRAMVLRAAAHIAAWLPFLAVMASSMQGQWRVVGDGAGIASRSWNVATAHVPLVGQATRLARGVHDPGPLQYWLLAIPVHIDPVRGVLWGAALWCMVAASLAIEAAWSVLGGAGGLLTSGTILWMVAQAPGLAIKPYWNPSFGALFFVAALAACWAVMSGRRWWWPAGVITASVAIQAHLMFAVASAALVFLALIVGLADAFRARASYLWALIGLGAGVGCWAAPFIQQFTSRHGNLAALLHGQGAGQRTGLSFALKTLTASTQPPPLWWPVPHPVLPAARLIDGRPAVFAVAVLGVTAAVMVLAAFEFRSRPLAALAAVSLLADAAALVTFSHIPAKNADLARLGYLLTVMVPVGLLAWFTAGAALALTVRGVIARRRRRAAGHAGPRDGQPGAARAWTRWAASAAGIAAVPLIVLGSFPGAVPRVAAFPANAQQAKAVSVASQVIERATPSQPIALAVAGANVHYCRRLGLGLAWALNAGGYQPELVKHLAHRRRIPQVTVLLQGTGIDVDITGNDGRVAELTSDPRPLTVRRDQTGASTPPLLPRPQ